ncbi:TPA: urea carboxylase-associated family protein [Clostridioides difficile]|nr:urea carboxylase-associated family protein [Clostridioides difficile]HBP9401277.1 urea carboxylase-associated family protein [Clostridioides difficile]HBP9408272.1 urea carboxylase-associated family protein [Clostridioides difficile]
MINWNLWRTLNMEYIINPCSGIKIKVTKGQKIEIVDIKGGQVVDFFAEMQDDSAEFISPGVTIDCNESLRLQVGNLMYSNKYKPMFKILYDDVREHDLLHPCCKLEMYDFFYNNGENHPNCFDNINQALGTSHQIIHPINLFMYTKLNTDGSIEVCEPLSKANDKIVLEALENMTLGIAACSVSESSCNSRKCTSIKIVVD